jgi:hypothetical protein
MIELWNTDRHRLLGIEVLWDFAWRDPKGFAQGRANNVFALNNDLFPSKPAQKPLGSMMGHAKS